MKTVGTRVTRQDAAAKATGQAKYVDDIQPSGAIHVATARARVPHARIKGIDVDLARSAPGVVAVLTAADVPGRNLVPLVVNDYPFLADGEVRFVGQAVALIAADTPEQARRAAAAVRVETEACDAVFDAREALRPGAPVVHAPDNAFRRFHVLKGDPDGAFASLCDVVVERTFETDHQVHVYLETQGMVAEPDGRGGVVVTGSMQCPYYVLSAVCAATGLARNMVHVVQSETGGGFGGKEDVPSIVAAHAALVCQRTGRAVKVIYDREEDFTSMSKRHPGWARVRYGATRDGKLVACDVEYVINGGAYVTLSPIVLWRGTVHAAGPYEIPNVRIESVAAATNTVPCGAFRGFGQPQVAFGQESCLDELARELGMDPAELRRRNVLHLGSTTSTGQEIRESCGLSAALETVLEASSWAARRPSLEGQTGTVRRGLGVAVGYYGVGLGAGGKALDRAHAFIQIEADGSVRVAVGTTEMGQGARSEMAQIAADTLSAPLEAVQVLTADTTRVPDSGPTVASRTTIASGKAVMKAAVPLRQCIEGAARRLLGGEPVADGGMLRCGDRSISFADAVAACYAERQPMSSVGQWVSPETSFGENGQGDAYIVYSYIATVAEVEVDLELGTTRVLDIWSAIDVGKAVNPDQVEAQIEGGSVQATGYALMERLSLRRGVIENPNLSSYIIPTTLDVPRIHAFFVEDPYSGGPFGAKGFGEVPMIGTPAAIANAVAHALGARPPALPITPERVLEVRR